ncbi:MAG: cation ABC transporter substrate-binding protein [Verrucomicrobia bacterium]|nr:MAG: cation ABC transporter substrate-binding protein [Verrucomicrobiota bacterium]
MKHLLLYFLLLAVGEVALSAPINIVAAENFYGTVAEQIGGTSVKVATILMNPHQDPHEFQPDAATAKLVSNADILIFNGLGYDDWMERLLKVTRKPHRIVIRVADLIDAKSGANPHIWYDPNAIAALGTKIAEILGRPQAGVLFHKSMQPLYEKIAALKKRTSGLKVTATEPLFGYMASALGFVMLNSDYQFAMLNDTDPNFKQTADFEKSLTGKTAKILFYNSQVTSPSTERMQALAMKCHIPIVGITETQPLNAKNYVGWMLSELSEVENALNIKSAILDHQRISGGAHRETSRHPK